MKVAYFAHSLASCWNHGNAHFLRGVLSEMQARGHGVKIFEPRRAWSLENLLDDHGRKGLEPFASRYSGLTSTAYDRSIDLDEALEGAGLVMVHEWTEPWLVRAVGKHRAAGGAYTLLFHDTHHRAVSEPKEMRRYALGDYDGVLAFGAALAEVYRSRGWGERVFVWHEAADTRVFRPPEEATERSGLVWIGNWGDGERGQELEAFLLEPTEDIGLPLEIYGVRYSKTAKRMLKRHGAAYRGWLANPLVPEVFARHLATAHVPRRLYVEDLPGIPTIRVFEALACGIPLVSAPWDDAEGLFAPGRDFLMASDAQEMRRHLQSVRDDADLRAELADHGLETIRARHTCAHRVDELLAVVARIDGRDERSAA